MAARLLPCLDLQSNTSPKHSITWGFDDKLFCAQRLLICEDCFLLHLSNNVLEIGCSIEVFLSGHWNRKSGPLEKSFANIV